MTEYISKISAFFLALICTVIPNMNYEAKNSEEILLNAAIISDPHINSEISVLKNMLAKGLEDIKNNATENDVIIVAGDLTNGGEEKDVEDFYDTMAEADPAEEWIITAGNHDIGHSDYTNTQARNMHIEYYNRYTSSENKNIYYVKKVNGYSFIVICDESEEGWDDCCFSKKQLDFLDKELKKATKKGKPAFVICHWPLERTNGQTAVYPDSSVEGDYAEKLRDILEKYKNIFFISGHMHQGINGELFTKVFGFSDVETIHSVTYVNVPAYGTVNRYGIPWNGTGFQMEVYEDEVVFRGRNYVGSKWYGFNEHIVALDK